MSAGECHFRVDSERVAFSILENSKRQLATITGHKHTVGAPSFGAITEFWVQPEHVIHKIPMNGKFYWKRTIR